MIHPATRIQYVSDLVGYGVFATQPIPRGTLVWVEDPLDQVVTDEGRARLTPELRAALDRYAYRDPRGHVLCWDHAKFVNHSCDPCCHGPEGRFFEVAIRDIEAGEQLTDDYRSLGIEQGFHCQCGADSCAGWVPPGSDVSVSVRLERRLSGALQRHAKVDQPLHPHPADRAFFERARLRARSS